jgi:DEAD/DEAH box helicase domain-containing protein
MKCIKCINKKEWIQVNLESQKGSLCARSFRLRGFEPVDVGAWSNFNGFKILKKPIPGIYCGECGQPMDEEDSAGWMEHPSLKDKPLLFTSPDKVNLDSIIKMIKKAYKNSVLAIEQSEEEKPSVLVPVKDVVCLSEPVRQAISVKIEDNKGLYLHQKDAIEALVSGQNVILATNTSSGKSLCFQVAIMEDAIRAKKEGGGIPTTLYLAPLNALIDDQFRSFIKFGDSDSPGNAAQAKELGFFERIKLKDGTRLAVAQYHGGVSIDPDPDGLLTWRLRRDIRRENPQVIFTNPEMLSRAILPHALKTAPPGIKEGKKGGGQWEYFFKQLHLIVIDECHEFRGVFGAHMANLIRRVLRLCAIAGNQKTIKFAFCSATVREPGEFAKRLIGGDKDIEIKVIDRYQDKSERYPQKIVFVGKSKPGQPIRNFAKGMLSFLIGKCRLHTIAFQENIPSVQAIQNELQQQLTKDGFPDDITTVYTANFLIDDRKEKLQGLRARIIKGVVSTSALALGIDIGSLSASVLITYPGTISKAWQMLGRAGRTGPGLQVFLVGGNFLDLYWAEHPKEFLDRDNNLEEMIINPNNEYVVESHIIAANYDYPIDINRDREFLGGKLFDKILERIVEADDGSLFKKEDKGREVFVFRDPEGKRVFEISLRGTGKFKIPVYINSKSGKKLLEEDQRRALRTLYPGAIFIHSRNFYEVVELRYEKGSRSDSDEKFYAVVKEVKKNEQLTVPKVETEISVESEVASSRLGKLQRSFGRVAVNTRVDNYYIFPWADDEEDQEELPGNQDREKKRRKFLPVNRGKDTPSEYEYSAEAMWLKIPREAVSNLDKEELEKALFTAGKAIVKAIPIHHYAAPEDVTFKAFCSYPNPEDPPALFIYENQAGGMGLAKRTYDIIQDLIGEALHSVLENCPRCKNVRNSKGCPVCVADVTELHDKELGMKMLRMWLDAMHKSIQKKGMTPVGKLKALGFENIELIDSGGMGVVYKGESRGKQHAMKLTKLGKEAMSGLALEGYLQKRLATEPGLSHENILRVFNVKESQNEVMVEMEYADGGSLRMRIGPSGYTPRSVVGKDRISAVINEFLPVIDGVTHLHRNGIVHRDLKPGNILYVGNIAKVADLGIAQKAGPKGKKTTGAGTYGYAAPGQLDEEYEPSKADDVYSLALILHEMISGRIPKQKAKQWEIAKNIPDGLKQILCKCLELNAGERLPDADALGSSLRSFLLAK